jgi:hypothetical protein
MPGEEVMDKVDMMEIALASLREVEEALSDPDHLFPVFNLERAKLHISFATALELRRIANALEKFLPGVAHE